MRLRALVGLCAFVSLASCESIVGVWSDKGVADETGGAPVGGAPGDGTSGSSGTSAMTSGGDAQAGGGSAGSVAGTTSNAGEGGGGEGGMAGGAGHDTAGAAGEAGAAGSGESPNPSCKDLPQTCGPLGNEDCCARVSLPGGTFNRLHDERFPATVSAFAIDKYEVTVGRFLRFAKLPKYAWMPKDGDGKNPNNTSDEGWKSAWLYNSTTDSPEAQVTKCFDKDTSVLIEDPVVENKALNCISYYLAFAFCVWDGGRLPTEAEWNYAALHDTDELYPWGNTEPDRDWELAVWGCGVACSNDAPKSIQLVGSAPAGNAHWPTGEIADLSGNVGEWLRDTVVDTDKLPMPCNDCMSFDNDNGDLQIVTRGGSYREPVSIDERHDWSATGTRAWMGVRCVRAP